jgi:type II secretory pathway pseudopilin PulG
VSSASPTTNRRREAGFTLAELAIVFFIVVLLLGSLTYTLTAQMEARTLADSQQRLDEAKELLVAFAMANGRLPCPARYVAATDHSAGLENFCVAAAGSCDTNPDPTTRTTTLQTHGNCSHFYDGYLPATALGFKSVDQSGFALDPWGNRIRYAVAKKTAHASGTSCRKLDGTLLNGQPLFTKVRATDETLIGCVSDELLVCAGASGVTATTCGTATPVTNQNIVALVIWSTGKNFNSAQSAAAAAAAGRTDEAANLNGDGVFVHHTPRPAGEANQYDDQFVWLPVGVLYARMVAAGVLP